MKLAPPARRDMMGRKIAWTTGWLALLGVGAGVAGSVGSTGLWYEDPFSDSFLPLNVRLVATQIALLAVIVAAAHLARTTPGLGRGRGSALAALAGACGFVACVLAADAVGVPLSLTGVENTATYAETFERLFTQRPNLMSLLFSALAATLLAGATAWMTAPKSAAATRATAVVAARAP